MPNSNPKAGPSKGPTDFPLFVHKASKRWAKKCKGRTIYFERIELDQDGQKSLGQWVDQRDELLAGRTPKVKRGEITVRDCVNSFLTYKKSLVASEELTQRSFDKYKDGCERLLESVGKHRAASDLGPPDFAELRARLARRYGPVSLANHIQTIRSVFKHAYDEALLDRPTRFGKFSKPRAKVMREARIAKGPQDFTAHEIRQLLKASTLNMRAMILLAVQGGFGPTDCAQLTTQAVDLRAGWIDWPRSKTATHRRIPLWPETQEAIVEAIASRPYESDLVFIGRRGETYQCDTGGYRVAQEFKRVAAKAGVSKTFYCGRRTFQTQGEESRDLPAVQSIMGHIPPETNMSALYRQRISDDRLRAVVNTVRDWLWPSPKVGV